MSDLEILVAMLLLLVTLGELLFLLLLAGVARVRRWIPPLWLWVAMTLPPLGLAALGDGGFGVWAAMLVWVGMGPVHALVRLGRGRATRRPVRFTLAVLLGTAGLQVLVWMLPTAPIMDWMSGLMVLWLTLGTLPLLYARWGPPSRVRRAVPALWTGVGVLICVEALLRIDGGTSDSIPLPLHGEWAHVLGVGAGFVLVGLLTVRSRRELVAAGVPTVFAVFCWAIWPNAGDGLAVWTSDAPVARSVLEGRPPSRHGGLDPSAPASTLADILMDGPLEVSAVATVEMQHGKSLRTYRRSAGAVRLVYRDSPTAGSPDRAPIPLRGTVGEVLAQCERICRLDVEMPAGQLAREQAAAKLLEELRTIEMEGFGRTPELAQTLRSQYARTLPVMRATATLALPWELVGTVYDMEGLDWVSPRRFPEASLQIVKHQERFLGANARPLYQASFEGRVSAWTRARELDSASASLPPVALDPSGMSRGVLVVRDGIVEQVRWSRPSAKEVREMVGLERAERPPIPERTSPFDAEVCDAPPATPPRSEADTHECFAGRIRCGETVYGHTQHGTSTLATPWYRNQEVRMEDDEVVGEGPEQVWAVEVPPHTVARLDVFQPCEVGHVFLANHEPTCPVPVDVGSIERWFPSPAISRPWLKSGTRLLIVESADTPQPYAATLHCSTAVPGEQVDTGQPDGLLVDTGRWRVREDEGSD